MEYNKKMREMVGHNPLLLVAAGIILYHDGKILLQKRADNGMWAIHGGGMDIGESAEETAKREIFEEIGIEPISLELYGVFSGGENMHYFYPNGDEVYLVSIVYFCNTYSGDVKIDNTEVSEVQWFDVNELPENINSPVDRTILKDLKSFLIKNNRQ